MTDSLAKFATGAGAAGAVEAVHQMPVEDAIKILMQVILGLSALWHMFKPKNKGGLKAAMIAAFIMFAGTTNAQWSTTPRSNAVGVNPVLNGANQPYQYKVLHDAAGLDTSTVAPSAYETVYMIDSLRDSILFRIV